MKKGQGRKLGEREGSNRGTESGVLILFGRPIVRRLMRFLPFRVSVFVSQTRPQCPSFFLFGAARRGSSMCFPSASHVV